VINIFFDEDGKGQEVAAAAKWAVNLPTAVSPSAPIFLAGSDAMMKLALHLRVERAEWRMESSFNVLHKGNFETAGSLLYPGRCLIVFADASMAHHGWERNFLETTLAKGLPTAIAVGRGGLPFLLEVLRPFNWRDRIHRVQRGPRGGRQTILPDPPDPRISMPDVAGLLVVAEEVAALMDREENPLCTTDQACIELIEDFEWASAAAVFREILSEDSANATAEAFGWAAQQLCLVTPTDSGLIELSGLTGLRVAVLIYEGVDESVCWPFFSEQLRRGKYSSLSEYEGEINSDMDDKLARLKLEPDLSCIGGGWRGAGEVGVADVYYRLYASAKRF
jgi:hypothetical protein